VMEIGKYIDFHATHGATPDYSYRLTASVGALVASGSFQAIGAVTGSNLNVSNWDTAYGWGDHSGLYAPIAGINYANWDTAYGWGNHASGGYALLTASNAFVGNNTLTGNTYLKNAGGSEMLNLQDTGGAGATANPHIGFDDSAGTRQAYVGMGATGNQHLYLYSDFGSVIAYYAGAEKWRTGNHGTTLVGALYVNNSNTYLQEGATGNQLRIGTNSGYFDVGPKNTSWCHFVTDRAKYHVDKAMHFNAVPVFYNKGAFLYYDGASDASGKITISASTPSTPARGDIWFDTS